MVALANMLRPSKRFRAFVRESPTAQRVARRVIHGLSDFVATRHYEAARASRRTSGWISGNQHTNSMISSSLRQLRMESSALERNNPHGHHYCYTMTNNVVGTGPTPSAILDDTKTNEAINKLWREHAKRINADGTRMGAHTMMWQACFGWVERGSALLLRRPMLSSDGLDIPLTVELLEGDLLDHTMNVRKKDGTRIINGVEMNARRRVTAYHLFRDHPGDFLGDTSTYDHTRVQASDVAHLFLATRPGQRQGIPWMTASMMALHDLDDYRDAERVRKKVEAALTAFVQGGDDLGDGLLGDPEKKAATPPFPVRDNNGEPVETFEPGLIAHLPPGRTVTINHPQGVGGYAEYITTELTGIAAGLLIPYVLLSGDLSEVNYSSIRAGMLEFHRLVRVLRQLFFIPLFCQPMWDWTMEAAWQVGKVPQRRIPCEWTTQKFESVDPLKEAKADMETLRAGSRSLREIIAESGRDPDDVLKEMAETNAQLRKYGLRFEWQQDVESPEAEATDNTETTKEKQA